MKAYALFEEMRNRRLTTSMRSWSTTWLDHASNYLATHRTEPLRAETALALRRRLIAHGHHDLAAMVLLDLLDEAPST